MPDFDKEPFICQNPIRSFNVFGRRFTMQRAKTWWNMREVDGLERLVFISCSKIKLHDQKAFQLVLFKYMFMVAKLPSKV